MTPLQTSAFNNQIPPRQVIRNITSNYTVTGADYGVVLNVVSSASVTLNFAPSASLGAGFQVTIWNTNTTASYTVTLQPNNSEKIEGYSSNILNPSEGTQIISDGTGLRIGYKKTMRLYAENITSANFARPIASNNLAVAIGGCAVANGTCSIAIGYSSYANAGGSIALGSSYASGSLSVAIGTLNCASYGARGNYSAAVLRYSKTGTCFGQAYGYGTNAAGNSAVAIGKCATATGTSALSFGTSTTATPNYSTAIGNNGCGTGSVTASSVGAMALGGSYASGACSFAAAIGNNTSSYGSINTYSVVMGYHAKTYIGGVYGVSIGKCTQSGYSAVALGGSAKATGNYSLSLGYISYASASYSTAIGYRSVSSVNGKYAYAGYNIITPGDTQTGTTVLFAATTNATATVLTSDGSAASTANQINLPVSTAYAFTGTIVARQQAAGGTASAAWTISGLIRQEGTASTTTLVASTVTAISNVPSWTLALSADTTNGALAVTFTGAASTNIHCVATIQTSECTYA